MTNKELRKDIIKILFNYEDRLSDGFHYYADDGDIDDLVSDLSALLTPDVDIEGLLDTVGDVVLMLETTLGYMKPSTQEYHHCEVAQKMLGDLLKGYYLNSDKGDRE